jgi:ribose transport system substrate-binding protein
MHDDVVRMRSALTAALALAAVAVAGCGAKGPGSAAVAGEKPVNIAFLGYSAANGYTKSSFEAAKKAAEKLGATVTFLDGKFDGATQLAQARDAVASGKYQALEILPNNSQQMVPAVQEALAKGLKVAAIDYAIGAEPANVGKAGVDGITVQIADDMRQGGQAQGEEAAKLCAGIDPCKVLIDIGSKSSEFDVIKVTTIKQVLGAHPNVKVVGEAADAFVEANAEKTVRDVLQAHPDLNLIVTTGDQMCIGAQRAAEAAGKPFAATTMQGGGRIACLGWGASRQGVEAIKAGKWPSSVTLVPETFGAKAAEALVKAVRDPAAPPLITTQEALSPVGRLATKAELDKHPEFTGEWDT